MGVATAEVETLTAEVKTLQVGNRQVTLSVYRQLDWEIPDNFEAFGRINDGKPLASRQRDLVGRSIQTGSLARCRLKNESGCVSAWGKMDGEETWLAPHCLSESSVDMAERWLDFWDYDCSDLPLIVLAGLR